MSYIGVDIGGTKTAVVLGTDSCEILRREVFWTPDHPGPEGAIRQITRIIEPMMKGQAIRAIGVSCGGPLNSRKGIIKSPPNLPGWDDVPITELLEKKFGVSAFLQNDANAGALAEWKYGAGRGCENMIFLTFGTGMGAGLILNGRLYSGTNDMAGEVGHIRLEPYGPVGYGKRGSFEGFCSGGGIRQQILTAMEERSQSGEKFPDMEPSASALAALANSGDPWAVGLFSEIGYNLGRGLSVLIDILNPERIVIGSIYARCRSLLEHSMRDAIRREALAASKDVCEIVPAELGEKIGDIAALCVAINGGI